MRLIGINDQGLSFLTNFGFGSKYGIILDPSAKAFIDATMITDPIIISAINELTIELKDENLWNIQKAVYPFVGATAFTHKFNLIDPQDLDSAFRILWFGGVSHSSLGVTFNGINGYADTRLVPSVSMVGMQDNKHLSIYSNSATAAANRASGVYQNVNNSWTLFLRRSAGVPLDGMVSTNTNDNNFVNFLSTDSRGFFVTNRQAASTLKGYKNGVLLSTNNAVGVNGLPSASINLGRVNGVGLYDNKRYAFASIGASLSDPENIAFYNAVQTFQTTLNRQV